MRIQYRFPVRGVFRLSSTRSCVVGDALVTSEVTAAGTMIGLVVTFPLPNWHEFAPPKVERQEDGILRIEMPEEPRLDDARRIAAAIEARLAPFGVEEIAVNEGSTDWLPDSDREAETALARHTSLRIGVPENAHSRFRPGVLRAAARPRELDPVWDLQLAFFRAAQIEMHRFQFVKAFFYFFFFLEGLFGGGQIKKAGLKQAFRESPDLVAALRRAMEGERANQSAATQEIEAVIDRIVDLRGFLFHNPKGRSEKWSPREQAAYAAEASLLAMTSNTIVLAKEWPAEENALPSPLSVVDADRINFDRFLTPDAQATGPS